jgi:hypothetical protein
MQAAHGTPVEFERALWAAWNQNFCTTQELQEALTNYCSLYEAAE